MNVKKWFLSVIFGSINCFSIFGFSETNCPNFSGTYSLYNENNQTTTALQIQQTECLQLEAGYIFGPGMSFMRHLIFDNKKHLVFNSPEMSSEETCVINTNGIQIETNDFYKREHQNYKSTSTMSLNDQGNLIEHIEHFDANGLPHSVEHNVYNKVHQMGI